MNIILNSYCNLKCNYCFADEYMEETVNTPGKSMDFDYFEKEMLPRIQKAGVINFMGGEPTLHPRFNELLSMTLDAMSPYSNLGLFTNGLMKDHVLDLLERTVSAQGSIRAFQRDFPGPFPPSPTVFWEVSWPACAACGRIRALENPSEMPGNPPPFPIL